MDIQNPHDLYFKVYVDTRGEYRWTLYANNNKKIADSGEGYVSRDKCLYGISLVKSSSAAPIR